MNDFNIEIMKHNYLKSLEQKYNAVCFDIDGTLTKQNSREIDERAVKMIANLLKAKIPIVFITGRGSTGLKHMINDIQFKLLNLYNIDNIEFYVGEVENIFPELVEKQKIEPDVVFLDPPRKGSDEKTLQTLLTIRPKKIIYISCNPATLARDLKKIEKQYEIKKVQPVDMFPYTKHVECVVAMILKENL